MAKRDNQQWLADLKSGGDTQEQALVDLRRIILKGLPYALEKWLTPDDPRFTALSEEVAQETILRVMAHLDTFEGRSQFTTWVQAIAVRVALSELRRAQWRETSLDELLEGTPNDETPRDLPDHNRPTIETSVEQNHMLSLVRNMIKDDLSNKQRRALIAVAINELPVEEVARQMGTERNTLYKLLHDARLKLKKRLEQEGLSLAEVLTLFEQG